ncbi:MAG: aminodeoxychorismate synthase component I [Planctomycetota bacterium]|nr:MAG: aminodeoxychorismate synthase component I [Planctomycetota bacterium]
MPETPFSPFVQELTPAPELSSVVAAFGHWPGLVVFDSARRSSRLGRYSFICAGPYQQFEQEQALCGTDPFAPLRRVWPRSAEVAVPGLPPFQGGAAGVLGYELGQAFEQLPSPRHDELCLPVLSVGLYDWVISWDHEQGRSWLISQGWPETDRERRTTRAQQQAECVLQTLIRGGQGTALLGNSFPPTSRQPLTSASYPAPGPKGLVSNFTREQYLAAVERVIEYIRAGDIFQANLAQRLMFPCDADPIPLYLRLRRENPAPFAGLYRGTDWSILSASPERFLQLAGDQAETRPIKGTRRRKPHPEADLFVGDELRESQKDRAENLMIVDLLRNDLSRVCRPGTLRVPQLCEVETYETVQHLVSVIQGQLRPEQTIWDLLAATFPGGSITGAPKVRAMEIISEIEQVARGPYCGSLFYAGFHGHCDSNLLIRTFVQRGGWVQCSVGGGITIQSQPAAEYDETLAKAAGMLRVWEGLP